VIVRAVEEQIESELVHAVVVAGWRSSSMQLGEVEILVGRLIALPLGQAAVARRSAD
jgi:hypothetical protein